jgi:hypothetical protein
VKEKTSADITMPPPGLRCEPGTCGYGGERSVNPTTPPAARGKEAGGREILFLRRPGEIVGVNEDSAALRDLSIVVPGNHLEADAGRYAWYASLGLFLTLGVVWFARPHVL